MTSRSPHAFSDPRPDHRAIWRRALELLRSSLGREIYETWFADAHAIEIRGGVLHLGVPSVITVETLRGSFYPQLAAAVRQAAGRSMEIELRVAPRPEPSTQALDLSDALVTPSGRDTGVPAPANRTRPYLAPEKTFERFVEGSSNRIALTAARRVAEHPGKEMNPLFIYSNSGLGKTHLLTAIAHVTVHTRATALISSEDYVRQFIHSVGAGDRPAFQEKYESAEVLLVDDVQGLVGRSQTQEEFFNVFNALHQRGQQIVITSDLPPRRLHGLPERLVTRFEGGLAVEINSTDLELRLAILQRWIAEMSLDVEDAAIQMIAERSGDQVQSLLGTFNRASVYARSEGSAVTTAIVMRALAGYAPEEEHRPRVTIPDLITAVSTATDVAPELFTAPRRDRRTANARHLVMYLACEHTDLPLSAIGQALGGRDHSTVSHGRDNVRRFLAAPDDPRSAWWVQRVAEIRAQLRLRGG